MRISHHARRLGSILAGLAIVTTLASCGGDGDDGGNNNNTGPVTPPPAASNTPPAAASASSLGFIAYLKVLTPTIPETIASSATSDSDPPPCPMRRERMSQPLRCAIRQPA